MRTFVFLLVSVAIFTTSIFAARNDTFARNLFLEIVAGRENKNVVFSAFSVETMLGMILPGSDGNTASEIRSAIGYEDKKEDAAKEYSLILQKALEKTLDKAPKVSIANRLYVNEGVTIIDDYSQTISKYFGAAPETLKFDDLNAVSSINSWVSDATHNGINDVLKASDVESKTEAIFVSAMHFKGPWALPFPESQTHKADFHLTASEKVSIDFMSITQSFQYGEFEQFDAKVVLLPYKNSAAGMLILLPNKIDGLLEVEHRLATAELKTFLFGVKPTKLDLKMPKFKFEFAINLKDELEKVGLKTLFKDDADLSGIFEEPHKISNVVHKAVISNDENGTEWPATTNDDDEPLSVIEDLTPSKEFHMDHPFVFAIFDASSGNLYFKGHVAKV